MPSPPTNAGQTFAPEPLTHEETQILISTVSTRSISGIRLRALIAVMYGTGSRLNETLKLEPRDVDLQAGSIRIRFGKRKPRKDLSKAPNPYRVRVVGVDPANLAHLARWMDKRASLGLTARHPLFATYSEGNVGKPLDPRYVRAALKRAAERAGIDKRVHPHGLRHSLAFDLAETGVAPHVIKDQLGHESLATTDRYVSHLNPRQVIQAIQNRRPPEEPGR
ncbi:site-specific integrase [Nonomuraea sp. NPDC003804]|uniref:tyrosine-type recombinase/integrase n=1 Tax=Nonomuraea sp. NPDC003804 TaxID=3154547 RepID=UPI0033BDBB93